MDGRFLRVGRVTAEWSGQDADPVRARRAAMCCSSQVREPTAGNESQNLDRIGSDFDGLALGSRACWRICGKPTAERLWRTGRGRTGDRRLHAAGRASRRRRLGPLIRVECGWWRRHRRFERLRNGEWPWRRQGRQADGGPVRVRHWLQLLSSPLAGRTLRRRAAATSKGLRLSERSRLGAGRLVGARAHERRSVRVDRNRRDAWADRRANRAPLPATAIVMSDR
jgi:hypothetical protein